MVVGAAKSPARLLTKTIKEMAGVAGVRGTSWEHAAAAFRDGGLDFVLVDAEGAGSALDVIAEIVGAGRRVIALSSTSNPTRLAELVGAGASSVIQPWAAADELREAFEVVIAGGTYLGPGRAAGVISDLARLKRVEEAANQKFTATKRELEVIKLLGEGRSARQIATKLGLSERTVNTHVANLYRKLGVSNRVEAVREAMRMGLV